MNSSPRRYCVNGKGERVLVGLTLQETLEFEALDELPAETTYTEAESAREAPHGAQKKRWSTRDAESDRARLASIMSAIQTALNAAEAEHSGLQKRLDDVMARAAVS